MLNIKEEQGLPDLHAYHPAFGCRGGGEKAFKACYYLIHKSEFAENAALWRSENVLLLSCNVQQHQQKILLVETEYVIMW